MALRKILRGVKGTGYDDVQNLVREATSNDPTSPPDDVIIQIIKQASVGSNNFASVSEILWKRINDVNYPRHVCKGLILLQYLLRKGDNRDLFMQHTKAHISEVENLKTYTSDVAKGLSSLDLEIREHAVKICNYVNGTDRSEDGRFDLKSQAAAASHHDVADDDDDENQDEDKSSQPARRQDTGNNNSLGVPQNSRARAHSGDGPHSARDGKKKKDKEVKKVEANESQPRSSSRRQSLPAKQPSVPQQQTIDAPKPASKKVDSFEDMFAAPAASKPKSDFDDFDQFFGKKHGQNNATTFTTSTDQHNLFDQFVANSNHSNSNTNNNDYNSQSNSNSPHDFFSSSNTTTTTTTIISNDSMSARRRSMPANMMRTPSQTKIQITPSKDTNASTPNQAKFSNLLGDLGAHFDTLDEKEGGQASPFAKFHNPLPQFQGVSPLAKGKTQAQAQAQVVQLMPEEKVTPSLSKVENVDQSLSKQTPQSVQLPVDPPLQLSASHQSELGAYARYFNYLLKNNSNIKYRLPLKPDGSNFLQQLEDGVLLAEFINKISIHQPKKQHNADIDHTEHVENKETVIDVRAINYAPKTTLEISQNANLALSAAQSIGVKTGIKTLNYRKHALQIMSIVAQLVKLRLLQNINLKHHPELSALARGVDGKVNEKELQSLISLSPEQLLLQWLKFHLKNSGRESASVTLKDSVAYAIITNLICHNLPPESFPPEPLNLDELLADNNMDHRAQQILQQADHLGVEFTLNPIDIVGGNPRLNLALTASLFHLSSAIPHLPSSHSTQQIFELAGQLEEEDIGSSREERAFTMWINSLGIEALSVHSLFTDSRDGIVLLKLIDFVVPGIVDWKKVTPRGSTMNRFKRVENCNYCVELAQRLGFSVVNLSGLDLVDGSHKMLLAFVWQLMRLHILRFLDNVEAAKFGRHAGGRKSSFVDRDNSVDMLIVDWANQTIAQAHTLHIHPLGRTGEVKMKSFSDKMLKDSLFLFDLLWAIQPKIIDWKLVRKGENEEEQRLNASYAISIARKLGAVVFCLPEDIVEVNPRMILSYLAAIMSVTNT